MQAGARSGSVESPSDRQTDERKIVEHFGGEREFEVIIPAPTGMKEAAY
jgi:hypothetical protein